jgi:hypothetical protein
LLNNHFEEQALTDGPKQSLQPQNKVGRPAYLVSLSALFCARYQSSKWIFVAATDSTSKTKQGRWYVPLISEFNKMSIQSTNMII